MDCAGAFQGCKGFTENMAISTYFFLFNVCNAFLVIDILFQLLSSTFFLHHHFIL